MPIKARYEKEKEVAKQQSRDYYNRNKTRVLAREKLRYQRNREHIKARSRSYHAANRNIANARTRAWHKAHPSESKANKANSKHARRALEYATRVDGYGIYKWMKSVKSTPVVVCHWCQEQMLGFSAVFDHVIPISKGGPHVLENLCVCCVSCNSSKKNRFPNQWSVNGQTFFNL